MENYGPYVDPFTIPIPENSLVLITGPNGVGKTIGLDAMSFTFWGITSKDERGDDVVNNTVGKNCHTWVKFKDEQNIGYVVDRYHKHSKFKNTVHITRTGEKKPYKVGHREVSTEIERIICDRKTFSNNLMFGQKVKDFFTDLPDSEQKSIFWKILDLLKYSYFRKTIDLLIKPLTDSLQEIINQISVNEKLIEDSDRQIEIENKKANEFEENRKKYLTDILNSIAEIDVNIKTTEKAISEIDTGLTDPKQAQERVFHIDSQIKNIGNEANIIKKEVEEEGYKKVNEIIQSKNEQELELVVKYSQLSSEIDNKLKKYTEEYNNKREEFKNKQQKNQLKITAHLASISGNSERIKDLQSHELKVGSQCPTCLEPITKDSVRNIESILGKLIQDNQSRQTEIEKLKKANDALEGEVTKLSRESYTFGVEIAQEKAKLTGKKNEEIQVLEDRLKTIKQQIADVANKTLKSRIADLEKKSIQLNEDLVQAKSELQKIEGIIEKKDALQKTLDSLISNKEVYIERKKSTEEKEFDDGNIIRFKNQKQKYIETVSSLKETISDDKKKIERLEFWKEAYSPRGIPSMLIDQAIPFMNRSIKKWLEDLSNGRYLVSFDTISQTKGGEFRDKFSVKVLDTKTHITDRKQLSGGQTRIIDIATILTLRDLKKELGKVDFNLFMFDEVFDALDETNIGNVCAIMNVLKNERSILVISHKYQDQLEADEHIALQ